MLQRLVSEPPREGNHTRDEMAGPHAPFVHCYTSNTYIPFEVEDDLEDFERLDDW